MKKAIATLALSLIVLSPTAYSTPTFFAPWDHPNLDPEIKTAPSGDEVVADLTSAEFINNEVFYERNGKFGYDFYPPGNSPSLTWSKTFGLGEAYGPVIRSNQAFYEPETLGMNTPAPISGIWLHDDAFFNIGGGLPYPALSFGLAGGYDRYGPTFATIGPVDAYGNAFVSFSEAVTQIFIQGPYDAGFSLLSLVGHDFNYGTISNVPEGGSTLLLFVTGLLGLMTMARLSRKGPCPIVKA